MLSSYLQFKQKHNAISSSDLARWSLSAETPSLGKRCEQDALGRVAGNDSALLSPGGKLGTRVVKHQGTKPRRWSMGTLHLPRGQGSLCLLPEGGSALEGCQGLAWAGGGAGAAPSLSQQHLPEPSRSPALACPAHG